jgi:hypothetical protein
MHIGLWNGLQQPRTAGLGITCGASAQEIQNSVLLDIAQHLLVDKTMIKIMEFVAISWEPDWAVVNNLNLSRLFGLEEAVPLPGWITYFSNRFGQLGDIYAPPTYLYPVGNLGTLLVSQPNPIDPTNADHTRVFAKVLSQLQSESLIASWHAISRGDEKGSSTVSH